MLRYNKPFLSLPQQLALLKSRGLAVSNDAEAIECLHRNGYYRLSAYCYPLRQLTASSPPQRGDHFLPGSTFEDVMALYRFDKAFKLLLLDALERVEIAVRVEIAIVLGAQNPLAHYNPALLHPNFSRLNRRTGVSDYQNWIDKFEEAMRRSKDDFVRHHKSKYGPNAPLPIWIAIELWDFGMLSRIFGGLKIRDRRAITARFSLSDEQLLESWLRALNYVRNVIAHHGRLWNLNLTERPKLPRPSVIPGFDAWVNQPRANARVYSVCCILSHLSRATNSSASWPKRLADLVEAFPSMPHAGIGDMGFPANWQSNSLWQ